MITKLSTKIVDNLLLITNNDSLSDNRDVYIYGLECIFNTLFTFVILILWGLISQNLCITILWVMVFIYLRHFTGGIHAPSQISCITLSSILCISNSFVVEYYLLRHFNTDVPYFLTLLAFIFFAPTKSSKIVLSLYQKMLYKFISVLSLVIFYFTDLFLPEEIHITILYAAFIDGLLLVIRGFYDLYISFRNND